MDKLIYLLAIAVHKLWNYRLFSVFLNIKRKFYTAWISEEFASCGKQSKFYGFKLLYGAKYCHIGKGVRIGSDVVLEVYDKYMEQSFSPKFSIGNDSCIGDDSHITCINEIRIGNNVRMGRKIFITDNAHGASDPNLLDVRPNLRPMISKGPVVIEDNVWIGEMVCIMPGVIVGRGSIIGANAVVTKNVPSYCLVGGNPAKVIKQLR